MLSHLDLSMSQALPSDGLNSQIAAAPEREPRDAQKTPQFFIVEPSCPGESDQSDTPDKKVDSSLNISLESVQLPRPKDASVLRKKKDLQAMLATRKKHKG